MALQKKISEFPASDALVGTEKIPILQSGINKHTTPNQVVDLIEKKGALNLYDSNGLLRMQIYATDPVDSSKIVLINGEGTTAAILETGDGYLQIQGSIYARNIEPGNPALSINAAVEQSGNIFEVINGSNFILSMLPNGNLGLSVNNPTALLHLKACTAAENTASIKVDAGVLATIPVSGNIESDGTHIYWTNATGERKQLDN